MVQKVYEFVSELMEKYPPDKSEFKYPSSDPEHMNYAIDHREIPIHWWLSYGDFTVSIATEPYNYCDYYMSGELRDTFKYDHPSTMTCEIALIDTRKPVLNRLVEITEGGEVMGWVQKEEVENLIKKAKELVCS